MSNSENESTEEIGISDDQLPDDLQPSDDNPLAEGLDDGESVDDLLEDGKPAESNSDDDGDEPDSDDSDDADDADDSED